MDHNDFQFETDFIEPVQEFFRQIGLDTLDVAYGFNGIYLTDDYYFPSETIIKYERTLIKSSIIWDIVEDRNK